MNRVAGIAQDRDVHVARFDHPAGEPHRDPRRETSSSFSINIVDEGHFSVVYGGGVHRLGPGDAFLTFPGMEYRTLHDHAVPDDACLTLSFRPGYDREYGEILRRRLAPATPVVRSGSRVEYLRYRLRCAGHGGADAIEALGADAMLAAFDTPQASGWKRASFNWYAERVDAAREHMRRNLAEPHRLAGLARMVGMSPFHFARIFRALTGAPPHQYLLQARMRRARTLLRDGANVTQAASAVGYDDFSHFTRSFRAVFGEVPSRARRS